MSMTLARASMMLLKVQRSISFARLEIVTTCPLVMLVLAKLQPGL
jgi:hypothetical protein